MKKILLLLLLVTCFQTKCYCQSSNWVHYGDENSVQDFAIEGSIVWLATWEGLVKFDTLTHQSIVYNHANSGLPEDWIIAFAMDTNGVKWISTYYGLTRFDGVNWTTFTTANSGIPNIMIQCIVIDSLNRVWIGGGAQVSIFDGVNWTNSFLSGSSGMINRIAFHNNIVWFATSFGLTKFDGTNWFTYTMANSNLEGNDIERMTVDNAGNVWLIADWWGDEHFQHFDGTTFTTPVFPPASCNSGDGDYYHIAFDSLGNMLFMGDAPVTNKRVLFTTDNVSCAYSDPVPFVGWNSKHGLLKYDKGNVWTVTDSLYKFDGNHWTVYNYQTNPLSALTLCIAIDSNNVYWIPGPSGIYSFNGYDWTLHKFADSLPPAGIRPIVIDSNGIKWIGASTGLVKHDGNTFTYYMQPSSIFDIKLDSSQHLWIATPDSGVYYFDGINFTNYNTSNSGLTDNYVNCLEVENNGTVWLGTKDSGLFSFDGNVWTNYIMPVLGSGDKTITAIKCDSLGALWVGTLNFGLNKKVGTNWINFNTSNSAINCNTIRGLEIDPNNNLYVSPCGRGRAQIFDGINWISVSDSLGILPVIAFDIAFDRYGNTIYTGSSGIDIYNNGDLTFEHYPSIIGKVYYDANNNGIEDSLDKGMFNQKVISYPDSVIAFTNSYGNYWYGKSQGNYTVDFYLQTGWLLTSDSASYDINLGPIDQTGFDFGTYAVNPFDSLGLTITPGFIRCNQTAPLWINYTNNGTTLLNGAIKVKLDTLLNYLTGYPIPDSIFNDTLLWNFNTLYPGEQRAVHVYLMAPTVNAIGQTIAFAATGETQSGSISNSASVITQLFCSYDPNDKMAAPVGYGSNHFTHFNDSIEYTVRFQNCGNDTAFRIKIVDTLDASFDKNSFRVLASSHPVYTSITSQGVINFRFDSIMLPCKTANEPMSQGFVKYSVLHKPGLADPTIVKNYASIYFDANPPIRTNETFNTLSDIFAGINSAQNKNDKLVSVYPNPTNQLVTILPGKTISYSLSIYDALGNLQFVKQNLNGKQQLDLSQLKQGVYLYKVIYINGGSCNGKLVLIH